MVPFSPRLHTEFLSCGCGCHVCSLGLPLVDGLLVTESADNYLRIRDGFRITWLLVHGKVLCEGAVL